MPNSVVRLTSGQFDFSGGVDSSKNPTFATPKNPTGIRQNQLAWMDNCSCRGGSLNPRAGWSKICSMPFSGLFQDAAMYQPDNGYPYIMLQVAGRTFNVRVDTDNSVNELTILGNPNGATEPKAWFCQGEQFMVIQDGIAEPLVWDGTTLRRISGMAKATPPAWTTAQCLPTGKAMVYYMGRIWVSNGRQFVAGDIVLGSNGTNFAPTMYGRRDAILRSIENTYLAGGGAFITPASTGSITAMDYSTGINSVLGQGQLYVFTRQAVYGIDVPVTRGDWQNLSTPVQVTVSKQWGAVSDRSVVGANGDLFFRSLDGIRSLTLAVRNFNQWPNTAISKEMKRLLTLDNRALLPYASGINFNNRLFQTSLPVSTPCGPAFQAISVLDFDLITTMNEQLPPAWEGMHEGLNVLKLLQADYGGLQRAFAICYNPDAPAANQIEIWELSLANLTDGNDGRIAWYFERPSDTQGDEFLLKELDTVELWYDKIVGKVNFKLWFRPDQYPCWTLWHEWQEEACNYPINPLYPTTNYQPEFKVPVTMPNVANAVRPMPCQTGNKRPMNVGYGFALLLEVKGSAEILGIRMHTIPRMTEPYYGKAC